LLRLNDSPRSVLAAGLDAFAGIVRFRKGPEEVPASNVLLAAVVFGAVALRVVLLALPVPDDMNPPQASRNPVVLILIEFAVLMLCLHIGLRAAGRPERFHQTLTAILGCQVLLSPILVASRWMLLTWYQDPTLSSVAWFVFFVLGVWMLAIVVRILRAATEWPLMANVMLALTIEIVTLLVTMLVYPQAAATTPAAA